MIPQFALRLIVGLSLLWCLLPRRQITSGFFRIQMLVTLGLSVLLTLTAAQWEGLLMVKAGLPLLRGGAITSAVVSFLGSVLWTLERRRGGTVCAHLVAAASGATLLYLASLPAWGPAPAWLRSVEALTGGLLLGSLTGAMLLGHWYLTATGMPLAPLVRATQLAFVAVLLRGVIVTVSVLSSSAGILDSLLDAHWVWTLLRWSAGLMGPLVLTAMTFRILRYRNTQSATGVLFAAVILAFIGEAASLLLQRQLHWPL